MSISAIQYEWNRREKEKQNEEHRYYMRKAKEGSQHYREMIGKEKRSINGPDKKG